jgi:high affinity Mn2+ porin
MVLTVFAPFPRLIEVQEAFASWPEVVRGSAAALRQDDELMTVGWGGFLGIARSASTRTARNRRKDEKRLIRILAAALLGLLLLAMLRPREAAAQRSVAAPIYQQNLDALIEGGEEWLERLEAQGWFLRGQATAITQTKPVMTSPYEGASSLTPKASSRNTESIDLVVGRRLWQNAEFVVVPTMTRGYGFTNSLGIADFPNGEAFRLGTRDPVVWLSRAFLRQTFDISYDAQGYDPDPMRFTGPLATERVTFTMGKFSVWDFFDDNRYAHDGRTQFMSWGLVGSAAFDYAADARGFTEGAVLEWENGTYAVRSGVFRVSKDPNSLPMDPKYLVGMQYLLQGERAWSIGNRPGVVRLIGGVSHVRSSRWNDMTTAVLAGLDYNNYKRSYRYKYMAAMNAEQELNDTFGVFVRLGWNNGREQNYMYTEQDWSISGGISANGIKWNRPYDTVALGVNVGGISASHQRFLENGGIGFISGDGALNYAPEIVIESYYDMRLAPGLYGAVGWQFIKNPAYNRDRGPTPVVAFRLHAAF